MKRFILLAFFGILASCTEGRVEKVGSEEFSPNISREAIVKVAETVANWQIENFDQVEHHPLDWTNGALYKGMMAWAQVSQESEYLDWLYEIGSDFVWQPYFRMYHADDIVVSQMYLEMYGQKISDRDSYRILAPTKARLDYVIENPSQGSLYLDYNDYQTLERWSWCDALFMAPPVYVKMSNITGDSKYVEFMDREFKATYDLLYDKEEHLFYRDYRYFPEKQIEANGKKIFWGRGNGWVLGGLVSILRDLPKDSSYRPFYAQLYKEMAAKVAQCQDEEGFWHASMLDPDNFPNPETSSTAFFCYALTYGINEGLLDRGIYLPVVTKAWGALVSSVFPDGKLGWVQPIGQDPKDVTRDMTEVYGVGAFLLAATEMLELAEPINNKAQIITVKGPIEPEEMGTTLIHEHVMVDWIGADSTGTHRWDREEVLDRVVPYFEALKEYDVTTVLECTPAYLGRDPILLKKLSEKTGIHILSNTGFYGARENKYIPEWAHTTSPEEMAAIWIREFQDGIDDSGIRPGFIKMSVEIRDTLSEFHEKLIRAAAITHLETGLTIVSHTGNDAPALAQLRVLKEMGVSPTAFVWTHAQLGTLEGYQAAAARGAWISLDHVNAGNPSDPEDSGNIQWYVETLLTLKTKGLLGHVLLSHDAGWYDVGEPNGGGYRGYTGLFTHLIPQLLEKGFTQADINQLLQKNPQRAYALNIRKD